jgi:ABC-type sugar transport system ATPase subunit
MDQSPLLKVEGISKSFPGVRALSNVSLEAYRGEILAMVGENGAGKSTLIHILSGVYHPDSGKIFMNGQEAAFHNPHEAEAAGISVVFQELSLVPNLTVAENVFANRQPLNALGLIDRRSMINQTQELLNIFATDFKPTDQVGRLSLGNQQMVEIIKALARSAKVLILDEPTSSLSLQEADQLFERLRQLRQQGLTIIYVSHHLEEIFALSDRVVVLRDGELAGVRTTNEIDEHHIINLMVGRDLGDLEKTQAAERGAEFLRVENFSRKQNFHNVSFSLHAGEILTFFGLVGAGRTEIARALIGLDDYATGEVFVRGQRINIQNPGAAMRAGLAYLSEDRKGEGLFLDKTIVENFLAPNLKQVTPRGWFRPGLLRQLAQQYVTQLEVRTPSLNQRVRNLSGGNQQKVLLGEWLATGPAILIVDEPTRGIDVGTKQEIHRLLRQLARSGKAIMVISSDLPEALQVSDRIAVMREGRLTGLVNGAAATEQNIMALAAGVAATGTTS